MFLDCSAVTPKNGGKSGFGRHNVARGSSGKIPVNCGIPDSWNASATAPQTHFRIFSSHHLVANLCDFSNWH